MLGAGLMVVSGFIFFGLLDTLNPALIVVGIVFGAIPHSIVYGTQASLIAEQFTPRMRYSGASIGYQLASIIAGGPAPIVAAWLFSVYKTGTSIAIYIGICALIGFVSTLFMTEYSNKDISEEYKNVGQTRLCPAWSEMTLSKRWEDVEDIEKCRTAHTLDRDDLLVAIDLRRKLIAGPMIQ